MMLAAQERPARSSSVVVSRRFVECQRHHPAESGEPETLVESDRRTIELVHIELNAIQTLLARPLHSCVNELPSDPVSPLGGQHASLVEKRVPSRHENRGVRGSAHMQLCVATISPIRSATRNLLSLD